MQVFKYHHIFSDMPTSIEMIDKFEQWFESNTVEDWPIAPNLYRCLNTPPNRCYSQVFDYWSRLIPMSLEQFQKYWDKLEPNLPMLDLENVYYKDWNERGY